MSDVLENDSFLVTLRKKVGDYREVSSYHGLGGTELSLSPESN